jgi:hypothetical protein
MKQSTARSREEALVTTPELDTGATLAEGEGFEPPEALPPQRFSRPLQLPAMPRGSYGCGGLTLGSSRGPSSAARASTDASGGQCDRRESWCSVPVCPSMLASIVVQTVVSRAPRGPIRIQILSIEAGFSDPCSTN